VDEGLVVVLHAALGAGPGQVAVARRLLRGYLSTSDAGHPDDVHDLPVLLVSELVTNAILHAEPPVTLRAETDGQRLRVEVHDGTSAPPVLQAAGSPGTSPPERGRGLFLVASLADRWGWDDHAEGKAVWFELDVV
jgi:anti-sigma regulatory factor (Ser/Thr protein kinase)